jgi:hypothetical protein
VLITKRSGDHSVNIIRTIIAYTVARPPTTPPSRLGFLLIYCSTFQLFYLLSYNILHPGSKMYCK